MGSVSITVAFQAERFLWLESDMVDEEIKKRRDQRGGQSDLKYEDMTCCVRL